MIKIYFIVAMGAIVIGAYFYGANISDAKCKMRVAQQNLENSEQNHIQYIQNKRIINDKVYKIGVTDLRRILHDKYTIAE